jgi:TetR/AcrR family transcriptional repressor of nem operon
MLRGMMTTTQSARDRILDAAERLVYEHGFNATTLDAILADANASKGAFFHHFTGKEALGQALVARYAESDAALLDEAMATARATGDDPGEQALAFLRFFEKRAEEASSLHPGCLFVSFIYERGPGVPAADDVIVESIMAWRGCLLDLLQKAADDHPRLREVDLVSLADQVFTVFEGGFVLARATDDWSHLSRQLAHVRHYLELLLAR